FSYEGKHYHIKDVTFVPTPVRTPRIPIWIGGAWPNRGPIRRAARFDGYSGYRTNPDGPLSPNDVRAVRAEIGGYRKNDESPFDIAAGGWPRSGNPDEIRAGIRACQEAGVTWWCEYGFGPEERIRDHLKGGPIRAD